MPRHPQPNLTKTSVSVFSSNADLQGRDFSGSDIEDATLRQQNFFESILNGCNIRRVKSSQCVFQHTEFTETAISDCSFIDTSFDHADFVLARVEGSTFRRCTFQNAELRDSIFSRVRFQQCVFRNTTTSLCRFSRCTFDNTSASNFVGPSKRYNVFVDSDFRLRPADLPFLRNNFGLVGARPSESEHHSTADGDALFAIALDTYFDAFSTQKFLDTAVDEFETLLADDVPRLPLRLRFLIEVCRAVIDRGCISILSTQFLEEQIGRVVLHTRNRDAFLEMTGLIVALRVSIQERLNAIREESATLTVGIVPSLLCEFLFVRTYDRAAAESFATLLATASGIPSGALRVDAWHVQSTHVQISITTATNIPALVRAIRSVLSEAHVTIEPRNARAALVAADSPSRSSRALVPTTQSKAKTTLELGVLTGSKIDRTVELVAAENAAHEFLNGPSAEAQEIRLLVRGQGNRVAILEGPVQVRLLLAV